MKSGSFILTTLCYIRRQGKVLLLYRNKKVVVVGEHEEGEAEANFLADICEKVTYIPLYQPVLNLKENVEVLNGKPKAVIGEGMRVTGIEVEDGMVECDGIFFAKTSNFVY